MEAKSVSGAAICAQFGPISGLASALTADIVPDRFGRFGVGRDGPVTANHPAWIIGHLCLYPGRVAGLLEVDDASLLPPSGWEDLFSPASECVDDVDGSRYPGKDELVQQFGTLHNAVLDVIANVDDPTWAKETPVERYRSRFPTVLTAVGFLMGAHAMFHLGQLSTWRRFEGLGSAV